jgi:HicA toxin of bacterial toxin-antitoxin,
MNSKQRKALAAIFRTPIPTTIAWADIEALLKAVGCETIEGAGSRVRFVKEDEVESFHRPHPAKEAKRYQVEAAKEFLIRLGVRP